MTMPRASEVLGLRVAGGPHPVRYALKKIFFDLLVWWEGSALGTVVVEIYRLDTAEVVGVVSADSDPGLAQEIVERLQAQAQDMGEDEFLELYGGPAV